LKKKKHVPPLPLRIIPKLFPVLERLAPGIALRFFIYLFFTPFKYKAPEKEIAAANTAEKFSVNVNGKKIQCYSWGKGPVVLLVHGFAGRGTQLRKFIEPLNRAGFRAVAVDGPGHGASEGKKTGLEEFKQAFFAIAEKTGTVSAIIAHSFGGAASLYAISLGLPVKILVNIASPTIGDEVIKNYLRVLNASQKMGEGFKEYILKRTGKTFDEFTALAFIKKVPENFNLLLVHDEDDREVSIRHPKALLDQFPKAVFYQTSGLGHNRILKDDEVIKHIVTFILQHSSTT
jgi:pimeloyl-ACP methyl ester carboxylesterase